ncbi:MAG: ABC transporter ATP-binding protein/permease [Holosporales bacterium]|nr:ABC transporter ATP-binding protein/permease [Holosporales bacterium]
MPSKLRRKIGGTRLRRCYFRLLPHIRPYALRAILAIGLCLVAGAMDAVIAWSLKPYTDLVMVEKSLHAAWYIPFLIVTFAAVQGILNYFASYLNAWVGEKVTTDLKFRLYRKLLSFEAEYFDRNKSGDIVFRFNTDAELASTGLLAKLKVVVSRISSSAALITVLIVNSWQMAIIAITVLGLSFIPIAKIRQKVQKTIDQAALTSSKIITVYNESYAGNRTISSYNLAAMQEKKLQTILLDLFRRGVKLTQHTSWLSPIMHVIVSIGIGLTIAYGSNLIVTGQITSGNFVSFIVAVVALYNPIKNLGNNFREFQTTLSAVERIFEILDRDPKMKEQPGARMLKGLRSDIAFENVTFGYRADMPPVLKNFSLRVKRGETIALVGSSGGGKTTVVSLLPRFYDVVAGAIKINGKDIRTYTFESLRDNIAIVFQDNFLFSGTIRENVVVGKHDATDKEVMIALEMAYLNEFVSATKDGLDTHVGERGICLSGGQKQRIAIARAFIKDAPIIILDEATSALDNESEAIVQKAMDNLMADKTVFVIAHRLSSIKNADRIAFIGNGELLELGNHDELMSIEHGQYRSLYNIQFSAEKPQKRVDNYMD